MANNKQRCNCRSYNAGIGEVDEVVLNRPTWLPDGVRKNGIPVDACIADVISHLWANGVITSGCCCGHNGVFGMPSIVLSEGEDNYSRIRALIAEKDSRHFELTQWKRVIV